MLRISCLLTLLGILLSAAAATDSTLKLKWQNQSRNDLIVTTSNDTVQLEVKKQGKFDGAAAAVLPDVPQKTMVFSGKVKSGKTGIAYLQVKLYHNGKELNRFSSNCNREPAEELHVQFDPRGADRVELLCRTTAEAESVGASVQFSEFQLLPAAEFRLRLPAEKVTPGYEACSIELNHRRAAAYEEFQSEVSYRPAGTETWITALPLAYQPQERSARGSLLNLKENTSYELRIAVKDAGKTEEINRSFRTLSSKVPIAQTIELGAGTRLPLTIRRSGSPDGYIRYTVEPDVILDAGNRADDVILVDRASCIILDGLTLRGGRKNGIRLDAASHIQILNCDIAGFGRIGTRRPDLDGKFYENGRPLNNDAGIRIQNCRDILVERNYIHDPRGTANSWFYSHPAGPNAVFVGGTEQAIFRYNDFIGSDQHRWNDAVEGMNNGSVNGSVCRDAEIVGNYFAFGNDDGMELDGGQQNCRFLFNKSEGVLCGISTAPCLAGPSYLAGNLFCKPGDELGFTNTAIKNNYSVAGSGKLYFLHNTIVGDWDAMSGYGGKKGDTSLEKLFKGCSRNNLAAVSGGLATGIFRAMNDFDYDLFATGKPDLLTTLQQTFRQERHGCDKRPVFVDAARGNYNLTPDSPGFGMGEPISFFTGTETPSVGVLHKDLPFRPVPFHADAARLEFPTVPAAPATVTLTVTDPAFGSEFRIMSNEASRFFQVSPDRGTLAYGKPVKLTVSVKPEKITTARIHSGAFLIRLPNGLSRPVSVYADSTQNEALLRKDRANVIRGKVDSAGNGRVQLSVDVPRNGSYYMFLRSKKINHRIPVSIDGGEPARLILLGQPGSREKWHVLGGFTYTGEPNRPILFPAGKHTIVLHNFPETPSGFALAKQPDELLAAPRNP